MVASRARVAQIPESVKPLRERVLKFMETHVYPLEHTLFSVEDRAEGFAKLREVQAEAKRQGLWALGHPKEVRGITFLATARAASAP